MPAGEAFAFRAARTVRLLTRPRPLMTGLTRLHAAVLRASGGRLRRSRVLAGGQPVLSLTTTGRRSGRARSTALAYLRDGDDYVVFGANLGSERDPAWCLNLESHADARIDVDGRQLRVLARRVSGEEARRLWEMQIGQQPASDVFRAIAGREIPIFVLSPV